jgi:hypothetical protein
MTDDSLLPFSFPAVGAKKVTAAFDGGRLTLDGGVMLLFLVERRFGLRISRRFVRIAKKPPTGLSQEADVGVK